jgi:hypothetical protein
MTAGKNILWSKKVFKIRMVLRAQEPKPKTHTLNMKKNYDGLDF